MPPLNWIKAISLLTRLSPSSPVNWSPHSRCYDPLQSKSVHGTPQIKTSVVILEEKPKSWQVAQDSMRFGHHWPSDLSSLHSPSHLISSGHTSPFRVSSAAAKSLQSCLTLCNPIDGSPKAPLSLGFSRQEHWSGLPFPSPMHESENWKWSPSVVPDS